MLPISKMDGWMHMHSYTREHFYAPYTKNGRLDAYARLFPIYIILFYVLDYLFMLLDRFSSLFSCNLVELPLI
jgi:hypothetical protein